MVSFRSDLFFLKNVILFVNENWAYIIGNIFPLFTIQFILGYKQ